MKKTIKLLTVLFIILAIASISISSFATITPGDITGEPTGDISTEGVVNLGNNIVAVVRTVGVIVAVVILLVLGIKYMMGSAEEKADYKKSMIPYIVGAILIFASTTIVGIVYDMAMGLNGSGK